MTSERSIKINMKRIITLLLFVLLFALAVKAQGFHLYDDENEPQTGSKPPTTTTQKEPSFDGESRSMPTQEEKSMYWSFDDQKNSIGVSRYEFDENEKTTDAIYETPSSEPVARVRGDGTYQVYDKETNSWSTTTYSTMRSAIRKSMLDEAKKTANLGDRPTDAKQAEAYDKKLSEIEAAVDKKSTEQAKKLEQRKAEAGFGTECQNAWICIGTLLSAYDEYKGIGQVTAMFFPDYNEWTKEVRNTLSQAFCGFVSIQNCFESAICGAVLDVSSGNVISGNVLLGRGANGQPLPAGHLSAQRSLPVTLKGLNYDLLRSIVGSEIIVLNGKTINISEVDTTTLPAGDFRLYTIQYAITNIHADKEMTFNLEFKGKTTRKYFSPDKKLKSGETVRGTIEAYSGTEYDKLCMTFNPSLPADTQVIVQPRMVNKLCKPIAEYAGGATSIGNHAKEKQEEEKQGTVSQGGIV